MKILLTCGAIYFLLMSIAHAIGLKIPGLFIYFNVPSQTYQDKIISLLAFGWAIFFFVATSTMSRKLIKSIIVCGAVALAMLTFINLTTDFKSLHEKIDPKLFHVETIILGVYWLSLMILYNKIKENLTL